MKKLIFLVFLLMTIGVFATEKTDIAKGLVFSYSNTVALATTTSTSFILTTTTAGLQYGNNINLDQVKIVVTGSAVVTLKIYETTAGGILTTGTAVSSYNKNRKLTKTPESTLKKSVVGWQGEGTNIFYSYYIQRKEENSDNIFYLKPGNVYIITIDTTADTDVSVQITWSENGG